MKRCLFLTPFAAFVLLLVLPSQAATHFAQDIQPIFARHCYECHGAEKQKGKLRLDVRGGATNAIVAGDSGRSELFRRITLPKGHEDIMPNRGEPLSPSQIEKIRSWIDEGADWPETIVPAKHWAYLKPVRPALPTVKQSSWPKNAIDRFVLARLDAEQLTPSAEADRSTLLRRVYLDLIGLPPSPQELNAFLSDKSADAYEKVVDRLLRSPQYGEKWARSWLDLARYADSSGYQRDNLWDIWPYRDWVINAFNSDMPFDQFTIEQIAGDLLPNATTEQKVATGFNRCVPTNVEAGSDQEETRVNQVFDRVNTLGSVWLGTTLECAQCHNHKYDPITQKEYYQLFAFFNNSAKETDLKTPKSTVGLKFVGPYVDVPDKQIEKERQALSAKIKEIDENMEKLGADSGKKQQRWEEDIRVKGLDNVDTYPLDIRDFDTENGSLHRVLEDKSVLLLKGENEATPDKDTYTFKVETKIEGITGFKLEVLTDPSLPGGGVGRGDSKNPNFVLNTFSAKISPAGTPDAKRPVKFKKATASFSQKNFPVIAAIDDNPRSGWAVRPEFFRDHWAIFEPEQPLGSSAGNVITFQLEQNGNEGRMIGRFRLSALTGKVDTNSLPSDIVEILRVPAASRTSSQQTRIQEYYLSSDPAYAKLRTQRAKLQGDLRSLKTPQTLVMAELPQSRMSTLFVRGNFLQPGDPVQAATPAALHPMTGAGSNRLALAQWLVDTNNPLVARVVINRWWGEFFGHGLVMTPEDFGLKGDAPTHPELLDWLATEFMASGWSMKHMHRLIVLSATYRQSSSIRPELLEKDDQNKLYARGPRFRMDAEMIRDNALSVAGLLSLKRGGPPVHPYQPPGIWESKVGGDAISYEVSEGEDRYRRGLYTVWKRTSPYPSFINFDAKERNACVVKRSRSNTPLQALTLLNDPVYVEAASALARRVLLEKPSPDPDERIRYAFRLCLSRDPSEKESGILKTLFDEQLRTARSSSQVNRALFGSVVIPEKIELPEFSAWHAVAWALLNLNETITRN